jgi:hypothetical protein
MTLRLFIYTILLTIDVTIIIVICCGGGILRMHSSYCGWDSSVGIATGYVLDNPIGFSSP